VTTIYSEVLSPPRIKPEKWLAKLADRFSYDLLEEEGPPADFLNLVLAGAISTMFKKLMVPAPTETLAERAFGEGRGHGRTSRPHE
jgi:hypothetical protein